MYKFDGTESGTEEQENKKEENLHLHVRERAIDIQFVVYIVHIVYIVYTVYIVYIVYIVYTVYKVYIIFV